MAIEVQKNALKHANKIIAANFVKHSDSNQITDFLKKHEKV